MFQFCNAVIKSIVLPSALGTLGIHLACLLRDDNHTAPCDSGQKMIGSHSHVANSLEAVALQQLASVKKAFPGDCVWFRWRWLQIERTDVTEVWMSSCSNKDIGIFQPITVEQTISR